MRQRLRPSTPPGLPEQLAVVGALALAAVAAVVGYGDDLAHDLREALLWLTPQRALVAAIVLAVGFAVWSIAFPRASPSWRRGTSPRVPVVALLGLIVVAASTFRLLLGRHETQPSVLGDELVYSGLAKGFALDGQPLFRGELDLAHSLLYPLLISPAHLLASDGARAYEATKAIDAIVVVSAAIPAYLLARRVVTPGPALVVAALVAFEPWTAFASLVMTESLFLPAFTTFVLLFAQMLDHPSRRRQLTVLAALAVLIGIRPQAVVLLVAVVAGVGIGCLRGQFRRTLHVYAPLLIALGVGVLAATLAVAAGADVPGSAARDVAEAFLDPVGLVTWSLWTLAVYELALGIVALVVFPLALHGLLRSHEERVRATGVALLTTSLALLLSVAAVSATPAGLDILHERYLYYVTPLVLVGLAHLLQTRPVLQRRAAWVGAICAIALAATLPTDQVARANNVDSPTAAWVRALHEEIPDVPVKLVLLGLAALGALVLLRLRGPVAPFVTVAVAFTALVCQLDYSGPFSRAQDRQLAWVDRALPGDGRASLVHLGYSRSDQPCGAAADWEQQGLVVWTEFFSTRVDRVFHLEGHEIGRDNLASPALTVGPGGVVLERGRPFAPSHAVLDSRQPVVGRQLARLDLAGLGSAEYQAGASLTLWEVEPPLRFLAHAQPLPPRADGREC
jgi:hypothetical protein